MVHRSLYLELVFLRMMDEPTFHIMLCVQMRGLPMGMDLPDLVFQQDLAISGRHAYPHGYNKQGHENKQAYRNRCVGWKVF